MEIDHRKVLVVQALLAEAINRGRETIEANDCEIGGAIGLVVAQLGGTASGVDEIADFAKRNLGN
jgi:hypothetical protein